MCVASMLLKSRLKIEIKQIKNYYCFQIYGCYSHMKAGAKKAIHHKVLLAISAGRHGVHFAICENKHIKRIILL